jgi:excisionase family DNA binding protein
MVTARTMPPASAAVGASALSQDINSQQFAHPIAYGIVDATYASGLGRTTLYDEMDRGALPFVKVGSRRLILRDDLVAFLVKRRMVTA